MISQEDKEYLTKAVAKVMKDKKTSNDLRFVGHEFNDELLLQLAKNSEVSPVFHLAFVSLVEHMATLNIIHADLLKANRLLKENNILFTSVIQDDDEPQSAPSTVPTDFFDKDWDDEE